MCPSKSGSRTYISRKLLQALVAFGAVVAAACDPLPGPAITLTTITSAHAGLSLRELPPQALRSVGLPFGLAVVQVGGVAERAGLRVGDVVYGINRKRVRNVEEFRDELRKGDGQVGFLVRRGETDFYVAMDLGAAPREAPPRLPGSRETLLRT